MSLRRGPDRFREMLEVVPAAVAIFDREMNYLFVSKRWLIDFRVREPDIIGKNHYEVFPEIPERWKQVHRSGLQGQADRNDEDAFVRLDGSVQWVRWEVQPWHEDDGTVGGIVIYSEDISERKLAELAVRDRESRLKLALDAAKLAVYELDPATRECTWDERMREIWGVGPDQKITLDMVISCIHPDDREAMQVSLARALDPHGAGNYHARFRVISRRDGTLRWVSSTGRVHFKADRPVRMVGMVEDITERMNTVNALASANSRLVEADRRKDNFLATLAHELRNPLAAISNSSYVLERAEPGGASARSAQAVVARQVQHLSRIIDDLLDVSRITRGKVLLKREHLDLNELVQQVVDDQRCMFAAAGVALQFTPALASISVSGDQTRLAQVISNLLQNAAKFTPTGGCTTIVVEQDEEAGNAIVRVEDNGRGIPPAMVPQVFEPFSQVDSTLDRNKGGLGLGLALVRGLVELHGGSVHAASAGVGQGATFTVRVPLDRTFVAKENRVAAGAPSKRILVIEDNVDAADTLRIMLELAGQIVVVAYDGPGGIEAARRMHPDLILCDIGLPGMDGFEVARALRTEAGLTAAKLVALSGYARPDDIAQSKLAGFDSHVSKPLRLPVLEQLLHDL